MIQHRSAIFGESTWIGVLDLCFSVLADFLQMALRCRNP